MMKTNSPTMDFSLTDFSVDWHVMVSAIMDFLVLGIVQLEEEQYVGVFVEGRQSRPSRVRRHKLDKYIPCAHVVRKFCHGFLMIRLRLYQYWPTSLIRALAERPNANLLCGVFLQLPIVGVFRQFCSFFLVIIDVKKV